MANYFVASGGSNTAPYDTWAKAATSLQTALTAANAANDVVAIQYDGVPAGDAENGANTTYTFAANISLISSTNSGTSTITPTLMGDSYWIGNSTTTWTLTMAGAFSVYCYGVTLRGAGAGLHTMTLNVDGGSRQWESCTLWPGCTLFQAFNAGAVTGAAGTNTSNLFTDCVFRFATSFTSISTSAGLTKFIACRMHASTVAPSTHFGASDPGLVICDSCDWSLSATTIVQNNGASGNCSYSFVNCKVKAASTWLGSPASPAHLATNEVYVFNSASGDTHYNFGYYNAMGEVVSQTGIYANDGATYDGTNNVGWQVTTTANVRYRTPFITPWIDAPLVEDLATITPSVEIVRSGSATAYQNDEVWAEFGYQGTSGFPLSVIVSNRMALLGTPANQSTGSLDAGGWTGENATSWYGKLAPAAPVTPVEIGMLRARICVGEPSITVYVDPHIRTE